MTLGIVANLRSIRNIVGSMVLGTVYHSTWKKLATYGAIQSASAHGNVQAGKGTRYCLHIGRSR